MQPSSVHQLIRRAGALSAATALAIASAGPALADAPQVAHLAAYLPGDGTIRDVVNGVDGIALGGATFTSSGKVGQAFSLAGNGDAFEFGATGWQFPAAGFSIVAWVRTSQATGSQIVMEEYECAGFCPGNQASSLWRLSVEDGKASGIVRESGIPTSGLEVQGASVADGAWHHIAFVRDTGANKARVFVDGALSASADLTSDSDGPLSNDDGEDDPISIGAHIIGGTANLEQFFVGNIDEVGFYDKALSLTDIQGLQALATDGAAGLGLDNRRPTAVDDHVTVDENAAATTIDPTANDQDPEGNALSIIANSKASHGNVSCNAVACAYTPATDFVGSDSFTYDVTDGDGSHATGTVFVEVAAVSSSAPPSSAPSTRPSTGPTTAPTAAPTAHPTLPNTTTAAAGIEPTSDAGSSISLVAVLAVVALAILGGGFLLSRSRRHRAA